MLAIDHICFSYDRDHPVLNGCSLRLEPGSIHGILGPNGSGKTTLLDILAGRLAPDSGKAEWNAKSLLHTHVGYLEAEPYFYPMITGREYLNLFMRQNRDFDLPRWNGLFNLPLDQLIETYSSGMKKKLAFIGVLCLNRPVILLDEPFNNLDIDSNILIANILRMWAEKGKIILLTSHIIEVLTNMTDCIHLLQDGRIAETIAREEFNSWKEKYQSKKLGEKINEAKDLL